MKILLLGGDAGGEGCDTDAADGLERAQRRGESARHRGHAGPGELQKGLGLRMLDGEIAHAAHRVALRREFAREFARGTRPANRSAMASNSARALEASRPAPWLPETIRLSAVSRPTRRGKRCVPPAPGNQARA